MFKLFKFLTKREIIYMILVFFFVVVAVWCTLSVPDNMTKITTLVETGGDLSEVWKYGFIMLAYSLGDALCAVIVSYFTGKIAANFSAELRSRIYNKVVSYSMEDINSFSIASLVTRSANDVTQVTMVIAMGLQMVLRAPIIAIWAVFKITDKGWQWVLITAIAVAVVLITIIIVLVLVTPKFKLIQKLTDNLNRITKEHITGVRVVRAFNAERFQEDRFKVANEEMASTYLFTGKVMSFLFPTINLVMSGTSLAIYWVGSHMIQNGADPTAKIAIFSDLVVFMAYAIQIIIAFLMVSVIFIFIPRAQVAANRINEVLEVSEKIKDGTIDSTNQDEKGRVEFDNVTFKYPDAEEAVLENISFTCEPGQTVAFIGSTGSGKSTLINLVPRFYDVTEGSVRVDGVDVREYTQRALHNKIGYVSQKAQLFKGTIASNVNYGIEEGRTVTDEDIIEAMTIAQGRDIIDKSEDWIYQEVAQGGTNFSGGQKQRISIARAICRRPEIFIFDDSFSALDYKTDKALRAELEKHTQDSTRLIVAQRIGTVRDADKIVVLNEGKMVGMGTHDELMESCEVYRQIAYSQLSKEEL